MYLNRTAFQTMNYFRTLNAFIILLLQTSQHFFKCIYREKFQLSVYANKSVTYYTTFGKEENQKLHYFIGWSGLRILSVLSKVLDSYNFSVCETSNNGS